MTSKTILLFALVAIAATFGATQVLAVSSTGPWSTNETDTTAIISSCGTNLTDGNDYSCATSNSNGEMKLLGKVAHGGPGFVEDPIARMNADRTLTGVNVGNSPELTTSNNQVTFTSAWDIEGTIHEDHSERSVTYMKYGHDIYKRNWFNGWDTISNTNCFEMKLASFDSTESVSCTITNSGTNTYRVGGFATAVASNGFPNAGVAYSDFYTGTNKVKLTSLGIS